MRMIRSLSAWEHIAYHYASLVRSFAPGVLYFPALVIDKSLLALAIGLIGSLIGLVTILILMYREDLVRRNQLLSGFLQKFRDCEFISYGLEDYADGNVDLISEAASFPARIRGREYGLSLKRNIQLWVVKRGRSKAVPSQLVAYDCLVGSTSTSYIFVRDEPNQITPIGRFFVLHEIGHASWRNADNRMNVLLGWKPFLLLLPFTFLYLRLVPTTVATIGVYALLLVVTKRLYESQLWRQAYVDEVSADNFAVSCLSDDTRGNLAHFMESSDGLPMQSSMDETWNLAREAALLEALEDHGGDHEARTRHLYVNNPRIQGIPVILAVFVPVMGLLSRTPSVALLIASGLILLAWMGIAGILLKQQSELDSEIEGYLS